MTLTPAIIQSTLALNTTFRVGNTGVAHPDTVVINDASLWANIVSASTDKVNIILQILDPAGQPVYQNPGWATSVFAAPDLSYGVTPITVIPPVTLFYDQNGDLITGTYTVNAQVQVIQNWNTTPVVTLGSGQFVPVLNSAYLQKNLHVRMSFTPDYMHANMTVADITHYGSYASIVRLITVTPPVEASQSPFTNTSNSVLVTSLWSPAPYQGQLANVVTYTSGYTSTVSYIFYYQNFDTADNLNFCNLYCWLNKLWKERNEQIGCNTPFFNQLNNRFQEGLNILEMCNAAAECSNEKAIRGYIDKFKDVTGYTEGCGCGCNGEPSPVVPISPSVGPPGSPGVPGSPGANGQNGTNGSSGANLIWPSINTSYTVNTPNSPATYTPGDIPANALVNEGDTVRINIRALNHPMGGLGLTQPMGGLGLIQFSLLNNIYIAAANVYAQSINTYSWYVELAITLHSTAPGVWELQVTTSTSWNITPDPSKPLASTFEGANMHPTIQTITGYTPNTAVPFVVQFSSSNDTKPYSVTFIEGLSEKVGNLGVSFDPIYTNPTGGATYQNNALIGLNANQFQVQIGGITKPYPAKWTFVSSTGTITWVGGNPLAAAELNILPL